MGDRRAAFFDIDGTLLSVHTAPLYARYLYRMGEARKRDLLRTLFHMVQYRLNQLDLETALTRAGDLIAGRSETEEAERAAAWYRQQIRQYLVPEICARLEGHRKNGDMVALLTTTTPYLALPLAEDLGVEHVLATRLEVRDGYFTGRAIGPICYGKGKLVWARRFARERGIDLGASYFYTDSITDLPVLESVGHPRVVRPDLLLARESRRRGWPVLG